MPRELVNRHVAENRTAKVALISGQASLTYRDLQCEVNRVGNLLKRLGVQMEQRIAILLPDTPEWSFVFFGAMKIGAVAVPLNTMLMPKDYGYLIDDSRARVLVVNASLWDRIEPIRSTARALGARDRCPGERRGLP